MNLLTSTPNFATLIQEFFCLRLVQQKDASSQTVASYRDTFRLLLGYIQRTRRKQPSALTLADLDAPMITAFLQHLEKNRGNKTQTRNVRFAAIRSFMKFAATRDPASLPLIQRVLAIPLKRFLRSALRYLSRDEVAAIIEAPDASTWSGRRDRMLFDLLYNTGARVSEMTALSRADVRLGSSRSIQLTGKGRKQRVVPLRKSTAQQLREWMTEISSNPDTPLFPNREGRHLTRSGVEKRLCKAVRSAAHGCSELRAKRVSPHIFRHTTAMHMLQAGVDITVIALWLGHESIETTHLYVEANLAMKERALSKVEGIPTKRLRYRPTDKLLQFLEDL
jgi:site-specific recombinase XerD